MTLSFAELTHPGGRKYNEDAVLSHVDEAGTSVWVVCDGVGGHQHGDVASKKATEAFVAHFKTKPDATAENLKEAVLAAQNAILEEKEGDESTGMRTTLVAAIIADGKLLIAHIGDSRAYVIRDGDILHQTQDHSVVAALLAGGEITYPELRTHPDRNRITRALGKSEECNPAITPEPLELMKGDAILLCSDGLWEYVYEPELMFDRCKTDDPKIWLRMLFERVMFRADDSHDNLTGTAILIS
jgi:serine/threonine protein phosphatase PrpC